MEKSSKTTEKFGKTMEWNVGEIRGKYFVIGSIFG